MYRIHSITLTGFKRMLLNNIRKITLTPTVPVQLILGTNGSGKSSLLEQMSPLPAQKADFTKGGSKVVVLFKDGRMFTCTSSFDPDAHHSFVIDGEEENPGGTERVQRELCDKYFGVTQTTHDLQRGWEKFHSMKPARRREWFTKLCDADYTFAMEAFETLKKRANRLTGAVDINKKNLVTETAKIMSDAEEAKLEQEVTDLLKELAILQAERMPVGTSSSHRLDARQRALKMLKDTSMQLLRNKVMVPLEYNDGRAERDEWGALKKVSFSSIAEIDSEIDRLKHIVTSRETSVVNLTEQFNKYQRQYDVLIKTGAEGVESLKKQIVSLREAIGEHVEKMRLGLVYSNARTAQEAFDAIEESFIAIIQSMPSNEDRRFGRARYQELQDKQLKHLERVRIVGEQLQRFVAQKEHADQHRGQDRHTCPQCNHSFVVGVNEEQYAKLVTVIQETKTSYDTLMEEQQQLTSATLQMESYFEKYREISTMSKNVVILRPFWDHLMTSQLLLDAPAEVVTLFRHAKQDILHSIEIQALEEKIDELIKLQAAAEEVGDANLNEVKTQMEQLTEQLGTITAELSKVQRAVSDYSDYRRQLNTGLTLESEIKRLYQMAENEHWEHIEALRRESILYCIGQVENALALKQESLRLAKHQKGVVQTLQEMVTRFEVQELAAKTMVRALSPTHGLIAEGLLGFIRNFVGQMNTFINRIWRYPLQVIPTGYDTESAEQSVELDYNFKMIVERESNVVSDVSRGSEGMKEIVDLAFKVVAFRSLGLADTPLMLDEFGKTLDDEHRFAATQEIGWMMENGNYPQLFMISHYATTYSAFSNAEICVIDDRNIVIPEGREYNKHVQIVH